MLALPHAGSHPTHHRMPIPLDITPPHALCAALLFSLPLLPPALAALAAATTGAVWVSAATMSEVEACSPSWWWSWIRPQILLIVAGSFGSAAPDALAAAAF
eukprot:3522955-Rhodomonas_salina.1